MLDIVRLRVIAAIAAHGSVTKAAKHLKYSQPAVSHHLARLEAETGARLVQRIGRGIRLTPEGEHLARRAAEIVGRVDTAAAELSAMVGLRTGRVRVAGFQSALAALIPHAAATLRRDHPGIELHLADAHPQVALSLLRDGQVDAAVIFRYDDTTPDDIRATHLFDDPMHLISLQPGQTLRDHRDSAWIAGCENCRREFVEACEGRLHPAHRLHQRRRNRRTGPRRRRHGRNHHARPVPTHPPGTRDRSHPAARLPPTRLPRHLRRPAGSPATTAFITALHDAIQQTRPGEPTPPSPSA
ncbi:LysR family transcriptional regulator [Phytohabitans flavus]|uniref:LysR family transcriptional regulator n=1 Tax=Phytohabitans flavus TaxID=1076124 RepID=UPI00362A9341